MAAWWQSPEVQIGASMIEASGPKPHPVGLGGGLSRGLALALETQQQGLEREFRRAQIAELERRRVAREVKTRKRAAFSAQVASPEWGAMPMPQQLQAMVASGVPEVEQLGLERMYPKPIAGAKPNWATQTVLNLRQKQAAGATLSQRETEALDLATQTLERPLVLGMSPVTGQPIYGKGLTAPGGAPQAPPSPSPTPAAPGPPGAPGGAMAVPPGLAQAAPGAQAPGMTPELPLGLQPGEGQRIDEGTVVLSPQGAAALSLKDPELQQYQLKLRNGNWEVAPLGGSPSTQETATQRAKGLVLRQLATYQQSAAGHPAWMPEGLNPRAQRARAALVASVAKYILGTPGAEPSPSVIEQAEAMVPNVPAGPFDAAKFNEGLVSLRQVLGDALGMPSASAPVAPRAGGQVTEAEVKAALERNR